MAKKKAAANSDDVRKKAAAMREAQRKSELRTRNIIIGVVVTLVIAIIVAIILIIVNRPTAESAAQGIPEQFQEGQGISVTAEGVAASMGSVDTDLDFYFDYTCPGCVVMDTQIGPNLFEGAAAGEYTLNLHPVVTSGGAFNVAATAAAVEVAASNPENFEALHQAMAAYSLQAITNQDMSVIQNLTASESAVADIARAAGVPDDVIGRFDANAAKAYLDQSTNTWVALQVEGRDRVTSPEFVYLGTKVVPEGTDAAALYKSLRDGMAAVAAK